jgi:hypothetical protein
VEFLKTKKDSNYTDYIARRLVDMNLDVLIAILFLDCAENDTRKASLAEVWIHAAALKVQQNHQFIVADSTQLMDFHKEIIG